MFPLSAFRFFYILRRVMMQFLLRLWTFVRPYRTRLILGSVCGVLYGVASGLFALTTNVVVNLFFDHNLGFHEKLVEATKHAPKFSQHMIESLDVWLVNHIHAPKTNVGWMILFSLIPLIMLARGILDYLSIYLTHWSAARAIADIRTKLFAHLQSLSLSFFSRASTGDLIARITNDTQVLYGIIGNSFSSMVKDPVTVIILVGILLISRPSLILISVIVMPVCVIPIVIYGRKVRRSARAMQGQISELTGLMHESFTGNRIIKAYNLEHRVISQFRDAMNKYVNHAMRVLRANEIPSHLTELFAALGIALVFVYVQSLPPEHRPTQGDFVQFIASIILIYPAIKQLTRLNNQLHQAQAASQRVFELLETQSTVVEPANPVPLKAKGADIHFENVDFLYDEKPILIDVNLTIKAGQLVALVGRTGSGKTTITNLLMRFYDPQRGVVRIGDTDLRQVSNKDLRDNIALVTQETILFNDTIRNNIAVGKSSATEAEIMAASKQANAHEFIEQKEHGYDFNVGEKGVNVSGGQRQRIAIARAILKDAPILILDEATSALDSEVERAVQAELEKLMVGRTTLCIAHRLSTIQKADVIVVLHEGRIVETGTHAELLRCGGVYKKLYDLQFQNT
jgi:subfamily B ATP-binding cassette protein MsbA